MPGEHEIIDGLTDHVVPLDSTASGPRGDDLDSLSEHFDGKTVVGLGEATHGTKEFFALKRRLVGHLVEEFGYKLIGIEASFSETLAINEYVVNGCGTAEGALDTVSYWPWNTEEVLKLIEWVRSYNRGKPPTERVRFYGFDVEYAKGSARAIRQFLDGVDPDCLSEVGNHLDVLTSGRPRNDYAKTKEWLIAAEIVTKRLASRFENAADDYRAGTADRTWRLVQRHRRILEQACEFTAARVLKDAGIPASIRDSSMAENVAWILDHEDADRIALWAHNEHVMTGRFETDTWDERPKRMGEHLRERFGDDYCALAFEFGRGSFRAYPDPETADEMQLQSFSLDSPDEGTVPAILDTVGHPVFFLDLHSATGDRTLDGEQRMHSIGAVRYEGSERLYETLDLSSAVDGLFFVTEVCRSDPI